MQIKFDGKSRFIYGCNRKDKCNKSGHCGKTCFLTMDKKHRASDTRIDFVDFTTRKIIVQQGIGGDVL